MRRVGVINRKYCTFCTCMYGLECRTPRNSSTALDHLPIRRDLQGVTKGKLRKTPQLTPLKYKVYPSVYPQE
jgi:hypothetical protein